jgi:hypothetical protein
MTDNRIDMADCSNRAAERDPVSDTVRGQDDSGDALRSNPEHAGAYDEVVLAQGLGHEAQWKRGLHSKTAHHANVGFAPRAAIPRQSAFCPKRLYFTPPAHSATD